MTDVYRELTSTPILPWNEPWWRVDAWDKLVARWVRQGKGRVRE